MSKRQVIMLVSVIVAIIQLLGFPYAWSKFFTFVGGMLILAITYKMAPRVNTIDAGSLPYVEHKREEVVAITSQNTEQTQ
jgi:hypothetical protein